jgi:hypothetical protein
MNQLNKFVLGSMAVVLLITLLYNHKPQRHEHVWTDEELQSCTKPVNIRISGTTADFEYCPKTDRVKHKDEWHEPTNFERRMIKQWTMKQ